jgi:hypothetical protein
MMNKPVVRAALATLFATLPGVGATAQASYSLPPLVPVRANFGPDCNLALRIPRGAEFPIRYSSKSGHGGSTIILRPAPNRQISLYLGTVCYDTRVANVMGSAPVRFDHQQNQWVRYLGPALLSWGSGDGLAPDEVLAIDQSIRVYSLNNVNSKGFAYTTDAWTGDEATRERRLDYCLFRAHIAVCDGGGVVVGALADGPQGDLTPYVLQILRSIEFLPDEPPPSASAPSGQSSGPHH